MKRIVVAAMLAVGMAAFVFSTTAGAESGRYKMGGNGCYWEPNDDGPDQCSPSAGRWKTDGNGGCYWDANDSGPNQCENPTTAAQFWNSVALSEALNNSVTGYSIEDAEAAWALAYQYGLAPDPPEDMSDVAYMSANGGPMSCNQRRSMEAKAMKLSTNLGFATLALGAAAGAAGVFFPPAGVGIGAGALLTGGLALVARAAGSVIAASPCTP